MQDRFVDYLNKSIKDLRDSGLYKEERIITSHQSREIEVLGTGKVLNFCSNNYLGLADDVELANEAKAAIDRYGYGMASVRFICGTQEGHKLLEEKISKFLGMEDTINLLVLLRCKTPACLKRFSMITMQLFLMS